MQERVYLAELVRRARSVLGPALRGAYAGGSFALGGYGGPGSDLDVAVIVDRPLAREGKEALVREFRHEALPCPARGLELVVYAEAAVRRPSADAAFELNLNTGRDMTFRADLEPVAGELHWFAIDRAVLHAHGIALAGPPTAEVFADPGPALLLPLLADTLRWCLADGAGAEAVLAACRALRYAEDGVWVSKAAAAQWAEGRLGEDSAADWAGPAAFVAAALVKLDAAGPPRRERSPPPR